MKFYKYNELPEDSLINKDMISIDYCDSYVILKRTDDSIDEITAKLLTLPKWIVFMLQIRYFLIVKVFGLTSGRHAIPIINRNENEMVMGEDDKHLYFRISVMKKETEQGMGIYLTTIVKFNNIWGKFYFFLIKPFHKLVVKSLLKKI
jgi:hypothetical protein